jgi:hypothetical protein
MYTFTTSKYLAKVSDSEANPTENPDEYTRAVFLLQYVLVSIKYRFT